VTRDTQHFVAGLFDAFEQVQIEFLSGDGPRNLRRPGLDASAMRRDYGNA
jgi:hypothetical protein